MKKILLFLLIMVVISSISFATTSTVTTQEELQEACLDASIDVIKLGSNINVSVNGDSTYFEAIEINGKDRTLDFNGYGIYLDEDEIIKVKYRSVNNLILTSSVNSEDCGVFAINEDRVPTYELFEVVNYLFSNDHVKLIINGGSYFVNSLKAFTDCNHFRLEINAAYVKTKENLLQFDSSYDSDFIINDLSFDRIYPEVNEYIRITNTKYSNSYPLVKLGENRFLIQIDDEGNAKNVSNEYMTKLYMNSMLIVVPEDDLKYIDEDLILPPIPNIQHVDGVVTWGEFDSELLDGYDYEISNYGGNWHLDRPRSFNIPEWLLENKKPDGRYYFKIYAMDKDWNPLSREYIFEYEYDSPYQKLATPTNVKWDDSSKMKAVWDSVENATYYEVYFRRNASYGAPWFSVETTNNYYDFSDDVRFAKDTTYYYSVYACSQTNPDSEPGYSIGKLGWFEKGELSDVKVLGGILSWEAYEGAEEYHWNLASGGGITDKTFVDLREFAETCEYEEGKVCNWSVYAFVTINGTRTPITVESTGTWTYTKQVEGDVNGDSIVDIVDVRILLQRVIAEQYTSPTDDDKAICDFNKDDEIDIVDVRILLQRVISNS